MNIITQLSIFDNTFLGDLEKLNKVLDNLPDEKLIKKLEKKRGCGRNDYPVHAMWRAVISGYILQHESIASLIRELKRNSDLRLVCGFSCKYQKVNGEFRINAVPSAAAFSRFIKLLTEETELFSEMFKELKKYFYDEISDFGETLAIDGKLINSYAKRENKNKKIDGRRDLDADYTVKKYTTTTNKGEKVKIKKTYFGYRLHLIVDAKYELPVEYKLTKASKSEVTVAKSMIKNWKTENRHKKLLADRGYDGTPLIKLIESKNISPIIDIKNQWINEETRQYKDTDLIYNYKGEVFYVAYNNGYTENIKLSYKGYDSKTDSLRYGFHPKYNDKRIFRIKRSEDIRIFSKIARDSYKWKREYKKRTAVERVNGRLDRDFKFENHTIRGLKKMKLFVDISILIMLAFAKGKIKNNKIKEVPKNLTSWVA